MFRDHYSLEALPGSQTANTNTPGSGNDVNCSHRVKVDIVDGMAEVQFLKMADSVKDCSDLADHFTTKLFDKYSECDELRRIFDRYDIPLSLKMATRARRLGQQPAIAYRITDSTNIFKVPMKKLLSHVNTKMELSRYQRKHLSEDSCVENMLLLHGLTSAKLHTGICLIYTVTKKRQTPN